MAIAWTRVGAVYSTAATVAAGGAVLMGTGRWVAAVELLLVSWILVGGYNEVGKLSISNKQ